MDNHHIRDSCHLLHQDSIQDARLTGNRYLPHLPLPVRHRRSRQHHDRPYQVPAAARADHDHGSREYALLLRRGKDLQGFP